MFILYFFIASILFSILSELPYIHLKLFNFKSITFKSNDVLHNPIHLSKLAGVELLSFKSKTFRFCLVFLLVLDGLK
jgi:hypothetical protein